MERQTVSAIDGSLAACNGAQNMPFGLPSFSVSQSSSEGFFQCFIQIMLRGQIGQGYTSAALNLPAGIDVEKVHGHHHNCFAMRICDLFHTFLLRAVWKAWIAL